MCYTDGKSRTIGYFDTQEEAARARDQAIRDAGLQVKRHMNVDATGALVPREYLRDRPSVVGPDPARAPTETSSKYWGVTWQQRSKLWQAQYTDADNATQYLGVFRTQEAAAHRVNAAIETLPAHVQRRRRKNEIDAATGKLVPVKKSVAPGHGPRHDRYTRARRPRRAVNFDDYLQPDDDDGWD